MVRSGRWVIGSGSWNIVAMVSDGQSFADPNKVIDIGEWSICRDWSVREVLLYM